MSQKAINYIDDNFDTFLEDIKKLCRIPSIGFPGYPPEELMRSAEMTADLMKKAGLQNISLLRADGSPPYVYGEYITDPSFKTVLLYAHHDVQPPLRDELWQSPAFEPEMRDGRLYGRGTADDKAGILVHLASIEAYLKGEGRLPVNVKVLIDGEEECGSEHLEKLLAAESSRLSADLMVLADLANYDTGVPSLTVSLRGIAAVEVELSVMKSPLHSGIWGGPIPDPAIALSRILAGLVKENGDIDIAGIYGGLTPLSDAERQSLRELKMDGEILRRQAGVHPGVPLPVDGTEILEKLWRRPSLNVNSMESGSRKTAGNVLMDSAWARIGIRLAPGMDPQRTQDLLVARIEELNTLGMELKIKREKVFPAWYTDTSDSVFQSALKALSRGFGRSAVMTGCGGSIPFAQALSEALGGIPALLTGVEDPYTNAHSENESLDIGDLKKAMISQVCLFEELATQD